MNAKRHVLIERKQQYYISHYIIWDVTFVGTLLFDQGNIQCYTSPESKGRCLQHRI